MWSFSLAETITIGRPRPRRCGIPGRRRTVHHDVTGPGRCPGSGAFRVRRIHGVTSLPCWGLLQPVRRYRALPSRLESSKPACPRAGSGRPLCAASANRRCFGRRAYIGVEGWTGSVEPPPPNPLSAPPPPSSSTAAAMRILIREPPPPEARVWRCRRRRRRPAPGGAAGPAAANRAPPRPLPCLWMGCGAVTFFFCPKVCFA